MKENLQLNSTLVNFARKIRKILRNEVTDRRLIVEQRGSVFCSVELCDRAWLFIDCFERCFRWGSFDVCLVYVL
jgi:hypothetical protein